MSLPPEATGSMEVDTAFFVDPDEAKSDLVDAMIGELSHFHKRPLVRLRDNLAHGGGLLQAESDPVRAIELFEDVRSFAERIWGLA
jgi:hypothetical protein